MYIIRTIPGACGDIVSSVIDSNGAFLTPKGSITFVSQRKLLKKPYLDFHTLPTLLETAAQTYKSISCQHYLENIITGKYQTITVNINSDKLFDWCINRLSIIYPETVFSKEKFKTEMELHNKSTNFTIELSDIISGKLIDKLDEYEIPVMDSDLYFKWLERNTNNFPYSLV